MPKATLTQPPADAIREANVAVHAALNDMVERGLDDQCIADAMFAYALSIRSTYHGRQEVARHLHLLALRFADPVNNPLDSDERAGQPLQ